MVSKFYSINIVTNSKNFVYVSSPQQRIFQVSSIEHRETMGSR